MRLKCSTWNSNAQVGNAKCPPLISSSLDRSSNKQHASSGSKTCYITIIPGYSIPNHICHSMCSSIHWIPCFHVEMLPGVSPVKSKREAWHLTRIRVYQMMHFNKLAVSGTWNENKSWQSVKWMTLWAFIPLSFSPHSRITWFITLHLNTNNTQFNE